MSPEEEAGKIRALLARYPYDPKVKPELLPIGDPERLRGVPPEFREHMAGILVRQEARWKHQEELARRRHDGKPEVLDESEKRFP